MARTAITVTPMTRAATGVPQPAQQTSDQPNGMSLPSNNGLIVLEVQNTNAASRTVTVAQPGLQDGVSTAGKVYTIPLTSFAYIGPFPPSIYNQSDGTVSLDTSGISADIKYRALQVG